MNKYADYVPHRLQSLPTVQQIVDSDGGVDGKRWGRTRCTHLIKAKQIVDNLPDEFDAGFGVWPLDGFGDAQEGKSTTLFACRSDKDGAFDISFWIKSAVYDLETGSFDNALAMSRFDALQAWFDQHPQTLHGRHIFIRCIPWPSLFLRIHATFEDAWKVNGQISGIELQLQDTQRTHTTLLMSVSNIVGNFYNARQKESRVYKGAQYKVPKGEDDLIVVYSWKEDFDWTLYPKLRDVDDITQDELILFGIIEQLYKISDPKRDFKVVAMSGAPIGKDRNSKASSSVVRHIMSTPGILIDWEKEMTCPWAGMKLFHGSMNTIEDYKSDSRRCSIRSPAFTTPFPSKATFFAQNAELKGSHVLTYRLLKGRPLMIDFRYDNDSVRVGNPLATEPLFPYSKFHDLAGVFVEEYARTTTARDIKALFPRDSGVDGVVFNGNQEWVWFEPKTTLEWVYDSRFTVALANMRSSLRPDSAFYTDQWKQERFQHRAQSFIQGKKAVLKRIQTLLVRSMASSNSLEETQFLATIEDESALISTEDGIPFNVIEVDYYDLWNAVLPDAVDMFMSSASFDQNGNFTRGLPEIHDKLVEAIEWIRSSAIGSRYPVQLLVKLPSGRVQMVPPITPDMKRRLASSSKRRRETPSDTSQSSNRQRTKSPTRVGTKGKMRLIC